jgi:hypothetical protein
MNQTPLTEEEEIKIAALMVLIDIISKGIADGHTNPELEQCLLELKASEKRLVATLTEEEKKRTLKRYQIDRKNTKSLNNTQPH